MVVSSAREQRLKFDSNIGSDCLRAIRDVCSSRKEMKSYLSRDDVSFQLFAKYETQSIRGITV